MKKLFLLGIAFVLLGCVAEPRKADKVRPEFCFQGFVSYYKHESQVGEILPKVVNDRIIGCNYPNFTRLN
jgi:hypothetical protein